MGRPSNQRDLDGEFRSSARHVDDIRAVVAFLKRESGKPVWLVGTSRGTISAAAGAIGLDLEIAGVVLTSSITSYAIAGAPAKQALESVHVPVLVMHHVRDACRFCQPHETAWIMKGLVNAPRKQLLLVDGGAEPIGPDCEAMHWHGFINMEAEAVGLIARWIRQAAP